MKFTLRLAALLVLFVSSACVTRQTVVESSEMSGPAVYSGFWTREELFFGRNIADGTIVSDSAFAGFVEREVVPRLSSGFTLYDATGYYAESSGATIREPSKVLVVLYREEDTNTSRAIAELIARYKRQFRQESVLRVTNRVRAGF